MQQGRTESLKRWLTMIAVVLGELEALVVEGEVFDKALCCVWKFGKRAGLLRAFIRLRIARL
jgi:hypothetical protein